VICLRNMSVKKAIPRIGTSNLLMMHYFQQF